jgi:hypothetical protein
MCPMCLCVSKKSTLIVHKKEIFPFFYTTIL